MFFLDHQAKSQGPRQILASFLWIQLDLSLYHSAQNSPWRERNLKVTILPQKQRQGLPRLEMWAYSLLFFPPLPPLLVQVCEFETRRLTRSRHWSLWTRSIFKWAMRTWTVYRSWKNEIWGEKRKVDTCRETDLWGWGEAKRRAILRQDA